ncbi:MAG: hypothetical protein AAF684_04690 [Pseudomonadota bacterium]
MKRIEVVIESTMAEQALELAGESGVRGYSILPVLGGKGDLGRWKCGELTSAYDYVCIFAITQEETARKWIAALGEVLTDYSGVVAMSDVDVLRVERF